MTNRLTVVLPEDVLTDIRDIVSETRDGYETGVALFGTGIANRRVVLAVSGPGPRATHEPAHYCSDTEYTSGVYAALTRALPSICWLGEFHLHPRGMVWLSGGDLRTVQGLLSSQAQDTLRLEEFIAGVMQRTKSGIDIYPFYFSRTALEGTAVPIELVPSHAPLVREARALAAEPALERKPEDEHMEEIKEAPASTCQRWLERVVNLLRRKQS